MKTSTTKILTSAIVLLLLVNIAMIILMLRGKHPHDTKENRGKGGGSFEMMMKELNMTEQQKTEHQKLRDEYFATARPLFDSVRAAKQAFFGLVKDPNVSDSLLNSYANRIAERQLVVDKLTFEHFRKVRVLYQGDQQKKYDELVQKMMQRSPGGRRKDSTEKNR